jgi:uncharacterized membrane protein YidH (DUF202 family)
VKKVLEDKKLPHTEHGEDSSDSRASGLLCCAIAFVACILVSLAPLNRLAGVDYFRSLPLSTWPLAIGTWLPLDLHLVANARQSQLSTHLILFLSLVALAFVIYAGGAWYLRRSSEHTIHKRNPYMMRWIWLATVIVGIALVFTPSMLSHDAFVYAGYGRLLTVYHENPYFVTLSTHPHDPFTRLDDWNNAPAAYGPVWLIISMLGSWLAGDQPLAYILCYRLLGLGAHLLNMVLIGMILRASGRSERMVALGTLLYAWNPLALLESCLGAHMDTAMVTLMLGGILCWLRREQPDRKPDIRAALPSLLCFTLAALIKFTAAPLAVLFLVLLGRKTLYASRNGLGEGVFQWQAAIRVVVIGGAVGAGCALALYIPFWIGQSPHAIIASFTSPPSANAAYGSILSAILNWIRWHGAANPGWRETPLLFFSQYKVWQNIVLIVLVATMIGGIVWIWKRPTVRTLTLATVAVLGALLLVTPWFFPWYVTWLVGLAAACLPMRDRLGRAVIGAVLAFSASAFCIYLFRGFLPIGDWEGFTSLATVGPPLLTLVMLLLFGCDTSNDSSPESRT